VPNGRRAHVSERSTRRDCSLEGRADLEVGRGPEVRPSGGVPYYDSVRSWSVTVR